MRDGARQITALYIAGDMCDLHSVVAPTIGWGITALSASTVFYVPHNASQDLALRATEIVIAFWRDTTLDASILAKTVANLGRKDARARTAHLLCEMAIRTTNAGRGNRSRFRLELTQVQIGDALGLISVHVNRTLRSLRREGLASFRSSLVEIFDWDGLVRVAEFTPEYLLDRRKNAAE